MRMPVVLLLLFLNLIFTHSSRADCDTFFNNSTDLIINDSTQREKGTVVADYTSELGNDTTLQFTTTRCNALLEINRTQLILKENMLSQSVCKMESTFICGWKCLGDQYTTKNDLKVEIKRISRGKFSFRESMYYTNISESAGVDKEVFEFSKANVYREDCLDYSQTFFSIEASESPFDMNQNKIVLKHRLDYDTGNTEYNLTISATNYGTSEQLVNHTTLNIAVIDVDDMDPEFDHDQYILHIPEENATIKNISLETKPPILAMDRDRGEGKQELYYQFEDGTNSNGCFMIDKITGKISTSCVLDRELNSTFQLIIKAVQRNTDLRSCTATLSIFVGDVNDHTPEFQTTNFSVTVPENSERNTSIMQVSAVDQDQGVNSEVGYQILPADSHTFYVDDEGVIRVKTPSNLDRESGNGKMDIKVVAYDKQSGNYSTSTATVHITLSDVNDVAPVFEQNEYTFSLSFDPKEGDSIGQVKAFDGDEVNSPNSEIRYHLGKTLFSHMFSINNQTGLISIRKVPPATENLLELAVLAVDLGHPSLQTFAQILLSRTLVVGYAVSFTVPESEQEVLKRIADIQKGISDILNLDVSVHDVSTVDSDKHSCLLNVTAKFLNDTHVNGEILQSLVLQRMSEILALFSNGESASRVSTDDNFPPEVIALIAACGVLFIGIIVLIGYICSKTRRFRRYKQLHDHLTRKSSIYESQEMKIHMDDEQTSDYNGSLNGSNDLPSLQNATTGELKEGVVSAFTNPAYNIDEETSVKLSPAEEEAQQSLDDLTNRLDAEETNAMPVDSYNPSENEIEVEIKPDYEMPNNYVNFPLSFEEATTSGHEEVPEDYPTDDRTEADIDVAEDKNEQIDDKDEPNPDYDVKAVRFSEQVLDAGENKFQPLREKEDIIDERKDGKSGEDEDENEAGDEQEEAAGKPEEDSDDLRVDFEPGKEADFGDGIENERTDEEISSPNEDLKDEFEDDNLPQFNFHTKL